MVKDKKVMIEKTFGDPMALDVFDALALRSNRYNKKDIYLDSNL